MSNMSGIMFNEDCNHFLYTRHRAGRKVDEAALKAFIDQYKDSEIKEFAINTGAMLAWYRSKVIDNALDKYIAIKDKGGDLGEAGEIVALLYDLNVRQGLEIHKVWISQLRKIGISPWVSIRMNDIHNNDDENHFLHSAFFKNKQWRRAAHRPTFSYYDNAFDFHHSEVRDRMLAFIGENLEEFDLDGLELDWMREVFSLQVGREQEGITVLNAYMRQIRALVDAAAAKKGRPIKLSVRCPATPEMCLRFGMDVFDWMDNGIIDMIVPTPRWSSSDNDMPIDLWRRIIGNRNILLGAGLEACIEGYENEPNKRWMFNTPETARATAAAYLAMGADRVYLFNYMDMLPESTPPSLVGTAWDASVYADTLASIGSLESIGSKPRRHLVTFKDIKAPGLPSASALPAYCGYNTVGNDAFLGKMVYKDIRIPTGFIPADASITLILGFEICSNLNEGHFSVFANAKPVTYLGRVALPNPRPEGLTYHAFRIDNHENFPIASLVEIAGTRKPITVEWAEIDINMDLQVL